MSSLDQLRHQLEKEAGVSPSITWLSRCLRHIRDANYGGPNNNGSGAPIEKVEAEEIWDQIRHSDLRNVIREPSTSVSNDAVDTNTATAAAVQLRRAIAQSKMNHNNNANNANNNISGNYQSSKACLPQNFQLMIQLEEVVDATMNSEQQLASMGGNNLATSNHQYNNNNNNNGNHNFGQGNRSDKWRCLKMVFSDGYYSNGRASLPANNNDNDQENNVILYAMETSPITNLSTASVPGTKILLHGPIQIRLGLLQLSDENAFVIGGQVPSWRDIWTKAREKAQREKGLGVDPTIKALIWNPLMGDEEDVDEEEGESGDVTAPRAPPPPVIPPHHQQPLVPNQTLPVITPNHSVERRPHNQGSNNTGATQNRNYQNANTNNPPTSRAAGNLRQTTLDTYPKQNRAATSNPYQRSNNVNTNHQTTIHNTNPIQQQQQQQISNPYASTNQQRQPPQQQQQQQQQQKTNPYASLRPSRASELSSTSSTSSLAKSLSNTVINESQDQDDTIDLTESPADFRSKIDTSAAATTPQAVISTAGSRNSTPNTNANSSKSGLSGNLSFSEFKALMQSLRHNRVLYEEHYGKEMIVLCKIKPGNEKTVFNIVKGGGDKKSKSKKDKVSVAQGMCFFVT
jgi:hypothetical protein